MTARERLVTRDKDGKVTDIRFIEPVSEVGYHRSYTDRLSKTNRVGKGLLHIVQKGGD